ncbi:hypothetical protein GGD64_002243 [Bradyrhizobium sp. CIR3A]|nr:hypothetical protein [Bradyrhizobium sp. CIR3A]
MNDAGGHLAEWARVLDLIDAPSSAATTMAWKSG